MRFPGRGYPLAMRTQRERTGFPLAGQRHHGRRLTLDPRLARAAATLRSDTRYRQVMAIEVGRQRRWSVGKEAFEPRR
jgi:hypothetical protein